ncbi:MAG: bifunctional folylpolyglutamate synthase/dihydrofolate synthase [Anaerolineales bacterium]|nr:bifunctional folylpolyglutamate synthase/dihydrofolate synthase [Anaerolineales bacterium]
MSFSYSDALDTLYSFINYELKRQDRYSPDVMTLERPLRLLELMGNPHQRYPTVHLTGTKGKGSVGAMTAAILQASGYKVGLYSSPHLQDFRERFQINQQMVSQEDVAQIVYDLKPLFEAVEELTWFEVTTALAFEYFARQGVDIAVIEVGLGGRLDATNVVRPVVSIITSLSYDHTHLLGNSLASIAAEKGGIIKHGVPLVSAPQDLEALEVLERICQERQAPMTLVGREWPYTSYPVELTGQRVVANGIEYRTPLIGQHQAINTAVVTAAIEHVRQAGIAVPETAAHEGLASVSWPGRLEIVQQNPALVFDAAHNRASARCLREALQSLFGERPLTLVFGAKGDKDIVGMMDELLPYVDHLVITQAIDSRAEGTDTLVAIAHQTGYTGPITVQPVVGEAVQFALANTKGMVCVTGSLYVVGEARTVLGLQPGKAIRSTISD